MPYFIGKKSDENRIYLDPKNEYEIIQENEAEGAEISRKNEELEEESFLDPNHTHFLLVDNGTTNKYKVEFDLRTRLELALDKMWESVPSIYDFSLFC